MVEFGLKLEDNKVAEWSDYYIRYEKLKSILKKCAAAQQRYNDLAAKNPDVAEAVKESYQTSGSLPSTPKGSKENLMSLSTTTTTTTTTSSGKIAPPTSLPSISEHSAKSPQKESSALLEASSSHEAAAAATTTPSSSEYGSVEMKRSESASSLISRALNKAASGVSDYLTRNYERQLIDALKQIDKYSKEFETCLLEDIERVNAFYNEKLQENQKRLDHLKESVAQIHAAETAPLPPPLLDNDDGEAQHGNNSSTTPLDDYLKTPLIQNKAKSTPRLTPKNLLKRFVHSSSSSVDNVQKREHHHRLSSMPLLHLDEDDVEGATNQPVEEDVVRKAREAESIQRALVDLYRRAKLLQNYAIMNYTGFVKIVKKHDKTLKEEKGRYKETIKPDNICNEGKAVEALAEYMEQLYANWFCDRNVSQARAQMLPKRGDGLEMDWSQLRLGYRMGACAVLGTWVAWDCIWGQISNGTSTIGGRTAFPVYRACGGLLLLQWFWGCSVWVWTRYRINYIYLFDFNPHVVSSPLAIFNEAVDHSLVFLLLMLLYYKAGAHDIPGSFPAGVFPFALIIYSVFQLIFPLRTRQPMWRAIWEVVTAPLCSPTFFLNYVGDIFTSMVKVFQDIAWTICFIVSGDWLISEDLRASTKHRWSRTTWYSHLLIPFITLLPLWFRFNQCLRRYMDTGQRVPNLPNAAKYALSQTVTLFGAFHPLYLEINRGESNLFQMFWMFTFVGSSLYSYFWDVYMDWGLGRPKYKFLGPRLMYPKKSFYYAIIAVDLVLRFAWVLTLVPPNSGASFALPQYLTAVSMMFELFRRTLWGFLRLENEQRSNTAGYRRVDFVPLHFSTGHKHDYKHEKEHSGFSVLLEVAAVTLIVLGASIASVVAAQHETERLNKQEL